MEHEWRWYLLGSNSRIQNTERALELAKLSKSADAKWFVENPTMPNDGTMYGLFFNGQFKESADMGYAPAQSEWSRHIWIPRDEFAKYAKLASDQNDVDGYVQLIHTNADGPTCLKKAAELGHVYAQLLYSDTLTGIDQVNMIARAAPFHRYAQERLSVITKDLKFDKVTPYTFRIGQIILKNNLHVANDNNAVYLYRIACRDAKRMVEQFIHYAKSVGLCRDLRMFIGSIIWSMKDGRMKQ